MRAAHAVGGARKTSSPRKFTDSVYIRLNKSCYIEKKAREIQNNAILLVTLYDGNNADADARARAARG